MPAPLFIGDEVSAAGWRLAGVRTEIPAAGEEWQTLQKGMDHADLILLTGEVAGQIAEAHLAKVLMGVHPMVLVIPDARGGVGPPDIAVMLKNSLGIGA
ncbi:MAG: hypothetical protein HQL52_11835 [Magnetococcales bacterium]|nr:hypothetical protein [Magnetococcales bacterium]